MSATVPRKIVIGVKRMDGNAAYELQRQAEKVQRQLINFLLLHWPRGFSPADAPPPCNEWTRTPGLW